MIVHHNGPSTPIPLYLHNEETKLTYATYETQKMIALQLALLSRIETRAKKRHIDYMVRDLNERVKPSVDQYRKIPVASLSAIISKKLSLTALQDHEAKLKECLQKIRELVIDIFSQFDIYEQRDFRKGIKTKVLNELGNKKDPMYKKWIEEYDAIVSNKFKKSKKNRKFTQSMKNIHDTNPRAKPKRLKEEIDQRPLCPHYEGASADTSSSSGESVHSDGWWDVDGSSEEDSFSPRRPGSGTDDIYIVSLPGDDSQEIGLI